ncbi:MAG: aldolase catalytic domain-containing protein [Clostridia bacterium]|nr:aldolase catalytic domain-containing protein [Clostridia bacterium]
MKKINLLDCTLRDGAYIVNGEFGTTTIGGVIQKLQNANVDIIECGWLKDPEHKVGTTYYHVPSDLEQYKLVPKRKFTTYVAMIDYNRYDVNNLPMCDTSVIDAIRIVFPCDKVDEGLSLVTPIREKGYKVYLQAANTLGYSDTDLIELALKVNKLKPEGLSIVDTFGAMYKKDLFRILEVLNNYLDKDIKLGFHSHNNQQLSYALSMEFVDFLYETDREIIVDGSLTGMGRGAGNTPLELIANYLNKAYSTDYDMNMIMDAIDMYITPFMDNFKWGYQIPYLISGIYECHVNNVAYLTKTHRTASKDIKIIFDALDKETRRHYDYDNLENVYAEYQNKVVDDLPSKEILKNALSNKTILAVLPGSSAKEKLIETQKIIDTEKPVVVGINSIIPDYNYDYLFFTNEVKYEYAKETYKEKFENSKKIITSNIKTLGDNDEIIINYNDILKRGWKYYDNSMIMFLRLMRDILPEKIDIVGFDGYRSDKNYSEGTLKASLDVGEMNILHNEIIDMLKDYKKTINDKIKFYSISDSDFTRILNN